jgi:hypothetical protein
MSLNISSLMLLDSLKFDSTYKRINDCLVKFHNTISKWSSLNSKLLNLLEAIYSEKDKRTSQNSSYQISRDYGNDISIPLTVAVKMIMSDMNDYLTQMGSLVTNLVCSLTLLAYQGPIEPSLIYNDSSLSMIIGYIFNIYRSHCEHLHMCTAIIDSLPSVQDRDTIIVYLSCILHKPCIGMNVSSLSALFFNLC